MTTETPTDTPTYSDDREPYSDKEKRELRERLGIPEETSQRSEAQQRTARTIKHLQHPSEKQRAILDLLGQGVTRWNEEMIQLTCSVPQPQALLSHAYDRMAYLDLSKLVIEQADFSCFHFPQHTFFQGCVFIDNVIFRHTQFNGPACFGGAQFFKQVDFEKATFHSNVNFRIARFFDKAGFKEAQFLDSLNFCNAWFEHNANFQDTRFRGDVIFKQTTFNNRDYEAHPPS